MSEANNSEVSSEPIGAAENLAAVQKAISAGRANAGLPETIDYSHYNNVVEFFADKCKQFADKPAVTTLGNTTTYGELDELASAFAGYLQNHTNMKTGDRIAILMPNVSQYLVAVHGALRAGLVVVNTNPLYTEREIKHQFTDAGVKAVVTLSLVTETLAKVVDETPVEQVIVTDPADMHPTLKRVAINFAAKYVKKVVPSVSFKHKVAFRDALKKGRGQPVSPVTAKHDDMAVLQYTGGTTGLAKGAMLSHGNLLANQAQGEPMFNTFDLKKGEEAYILPLPLYHIYSFTLSMTIANLGNHAVLIPNPRDIDSMVKAMAAQPFTTIGGINTLFVALCNNEAFRKLDFSGLKLTLSGGTALTEDAANKWKKVTGCEINQGYGLSETSPVLTFNPGGHNRSETIGITVSSTQIKLVDDDGNPVGLNTPGELCAKGPQVMMGYWQKPEETDKVMDSDGYFATGDVAECDEQGYLKIVDRKKDMIIVSGFNVYPNEIEDVLCGHPGIDECAAIGVPDEKSGECVKVFAVKSQADLTEADVREYAKKELTGYKIPRSVVFVDELPKTNVGKILRRELRDKELSRIAAAG